jgi:hypothetical protein
MCLVISSELPEPEMWSPWVWMFEPGWSPNLSLSLHNTTPYVNPGFMYIVGPGERQGPATPEGSNILYPNWKSSYTKPGRMQNSSLAQPPVIRSATLVSGITSLHRSVDHTSVFCVGWTWTPRVEWLPVRTATTANAAWLMWTIIDIEVDVLLFWRLLLWNNVHVVVNRRVYLYMMWCNDQEKKRRDITKIRRFVKASRNIIS